MRFRRSSSAIAIALLCAAPLAACGSSDSDGSGSSEGGGSIDLVASFYPLQWVAEQVGGDAVDVTSLTAPGAEPHDLELTPKDVATLSDADLVFYLSGFQPAVDDAVASSGADSLDAADAADLDLTAAGHDHDHDHEGEEDEEAHDHEDEEAHDEGEEDHDHDDEEGVDPHFWLDPIRLADVADALATELGEIDPDNAAKFTANAQELRDELETLDGEFEAVLADCSNRELVTSHTAFGYLAQRYGLEQVGISGLSPNQEPSPADLAEVVEFVEEHGVRTIYFETLVSPDIAETVASETGADTAVLDPLEGLTDESDGDDYLSVMRSNLASLETGQPCP